MNGSYPITHDIVLVGGGHSHALVLRRWAMHPMPGVRLTLISRDVLTPYSGMLPGYVAGHYSFEEIHIDLLRLCAWADVRFIAAEMTGIDLQAQVVHVRGRPSISYDFLSLDTGSTPSLDVPGAAEFATPVKPVHSFVERWQSVLERAPKDLALVGAGAGGFELVMAMAYRLRHEAVSVHWFLRGQKPMSDRPKRVGEQALKAAYDAGDGRQVEFDELLWCTAASAPAWPKESGLDTDVRGFVATQSSLQSRSHANVFATGDIGTQTETPSAKAGVFAVRQAPVLLHNLQASVRGEALRNYSPQRDFLSLVSSGRQHAIGSRSGMSFAGRWVWKWKDHIDRTFMNKFVALPPMKETISTSNDAQHMRCNGCGAKVPAVLLDEVLAEIDADALPRVEWKADVPRNGDTAVVAWADKYLVQSVDQLRALIDDPYLFGQIAALHALSDVHTENAQAHSAQVLLTLPYAKPTIVHRELLQLMRGITAVLQTEQCALVGGHTAEGAELQVGLVVNAGYPNSAETPAVEARSYALILTQPLGVGVLFAGLMQTKARGVDIHNLLPYLLQSNRTAARVCAAHGALNCTDVTGFGLLGHLHRMQLPIPMHCALNVDQIPAFSGVDALIEQGVESSLSAANQTVLSQVAGSNELQHRDSILLADPQTAGGLLAVVPASAASSCVQELIQEGFGQARIIGALNPIPERDTKPLDAEFHGLSIELAAAATASLV